MQGCVAPRWDVLGFAHVLARFVLEGFDGKFAVLVNTSAFLFISSASVVVSSYCARVPQRGGGVEGGIIVLQLLLSPKAEWRTTMIATARFSNQIVKPRIWLETLRTSDKASIRRTATNKASREYSEHKKAFTKQKKKGKEKTLDNILVLCSITWEARFKRVQEGVEPDAECLLEPRHWFMWLNHEHRLGYHRSFSNRVRLVNR